MMKETPINQNTLEGRVKKKVPIHYPASYATLTTSVIAGHSWASLDNISHVEDATETTAVFKNIKNRVFLMLPSVLKEHLNKPNIYRAPKPCHLSYKTPAWPGCCFTSKSSSKRSHTHLFTPCPFLPPSGLLHTEPLLSLDQFTALVHRTALKTCVCITKRATCCIIWEINSQQQQRI